jgi:hypothetical protein
MPLKVISLSVYDVFAAEMLEEVISWDVYVKPGSRVLQPSVGKSII